MFSGLLAPSVKSVGAGDKGKEPKPEPASPPAPAAPPVPAPTGAAPVTPADPPKQPPSPPASMALLAAATGPVNPHRFCVCLHGKPGLAPLEGGTKGALLRAAMWQPNTTITVHFLSGSAALQARVRAVAEEWIAPGMANLKFRWVDDVQADIRIAFVQGNGSWSYLGTVCRQIASPDPTMNFGWLTDQSSDDDLRRVVLHEFGHALGMIHEHQNPLGGIPWNKAAVIAELSGPPNNWDTDTINTNVLDSHDLAAVIASPVDATSIMMYPIPASWTDGTFSADLNGALSDADKKLIRYVYP